MFTTREVIWQNMVPLPQKKYSIIKITFVKIITCKTILFKITKTMHRKGIMGGKPHVCICMYMYTYINMFFYFLKTPIFSDSHLLVIGY